MSARWSVAGAGLLAALIAAACLRAESKIVSRDAAPLRPEPGSAYAVQLSAAGGNFDLALDAGGEYELIVASLGDAPQTFHVELEARRRPRVESFPAVAVAPLSVRADNPRGAEKSVHHTPPGPP